MTRALAFILAFVLVPTLAAQTTITLRDRADLGAARAIVLSDIADLTGPEAESLGAAVVMPEPRAGADGLLEVSTTDIRQALDSARVNWGRIALSGSRCSVRLGSPRPPEPRPHPRPAQSSPQPIDTSGPPTLRTLIASRLAEHFGVQLDELRLGFDAADAAFLEAATAGKRIDLHPAANSGSARLPVHITIYESAPERITATRVVTVSALVLRTVITATSIIERSQPITHDLVRVQQQWLPPGGKALATLEQVAGGGGGALAAARIPAGQPIVASDLTTPVIVKRGDIVYVHALNGNVVVKAKARALGSARDGELVQLRLDGSDRVFSARMSGRGRAVMVVPADDPAKPATLVRGTNE